MLTNRYIQNLLFFYILTIFLISSTYTLASEFESAEHVHISNIHIIEGDLYAWGEKITIDGEINGDLIGGGENVSINGFVSNSVNIFSNKFLHSGEIDGSLRLFVNDGVIDGTIKRSGLFFCNELRIGKNAVIGNDVNFYGGSINIEGTVHGNVLIKAGGSTAFYGSGVSVNKRGIYISGTIDGDLTIYGNNIHIISPALIKGNFRYVSENEAQIDISSGVTILGTTTYDLPEKNELEKEDTLFLATVNVGSKIVAAFFFGLLLMMLCKNYISSMVFQLNERFAISAAIGFVSLALLVICIIILIVTLILIITGMALISKDSAVGGTIILAISTIMVPISSAAIATLSTMIYSGKIILALLLGYKVVKKFKSNAAYLSKSQLFIGLLLLYLMFAIPYIGTLLFFIISIIGMGAIVLGIKDCHKGLNSHKISDQVGV